MNEEVKKLWVEALRSGKFVKGTGQLLTVTADGKKCHCALGVLCEVYLEQNPHSNFEFGRGGQDFGFIDEADVKKGPSFFNASVYHWAGVPVNSDFEVDDRAIWILNDRNNITFEDLAKAIEEQL